MCRYKGVGNGGEECPRREVRVGEEGEEAKATIGLYQRSSVVYGMSSMSVSSVIDGMSEIQWLID